MNNRNYLSSQIIHARMSFTRLRRKVVTLKSCCCWRDDSATLRCACDVHSGSDDSFPPKQSQAVARRLVIGRRRRQWRRARKAAGFPANNAKWCICQGEFVHRRRRAPRAPPTDIRHSIRSLRADRRSTEGSRALISLRAESTSICIRSLLQVNNFYLILYCFEFVLM